MENDLNRYRTPLVAETAVEGLPSVVVGEDIVNSESNSCAVCMTEFELNSEVKQMPCKHLYHPECILPWLKMHNSCPVCRFELPTDDQDYETRKTGGGGKGGDGEGSGSGGGSSGSRSLSGIMFNIPLTWLVVRVLLEYYSGVFAEPVDHDSPFPLKSRARNSINDMLIAIFK
ncbi:E3 ubiquitin-protein ligase RING1-like [Silene latifolia]|uniref:E3 ubiquitin-protein ligase RING1-like n=1 Tax=Silene latifolia TaxID=37657 RepID=UPI003D77EE62